MSDTSKEKVLNFVLDDLDSCLEFLLEDRSTSAASIGQILNTIRHFIVEITEGNLTETDVQQYFMQKKTDAVRLHQLKNHRHTEYSKLYVVNAFFTCVACNRLSESRRIAGKILNYCVDNCSSDIQPIAVRMRTDLSRIFS